MFSMTDSEVIALLARNGVEIFPMVCRDQPRCRTRPRRIRHRLIGHAARANWLGGCPQCRLNAVLNVLAEL